MARLAVVTGCLVTAGVVPSTRSSAVETADLQFAQAAARWELVDVEVNPDGDDPPSGINASASRGRIVYEATEDPTTVFDMSFDEPPQELVPGQTYELEATVSGRITGGTDTQGFRRGDLIILPNERWNDQAVGTGQACNDPIGAEPISCTETSTATGALGFTAPSSGEEFRLGFGVLNCGGACYVRYSYVLEQAPATTTTSTTEATTTSTTEATTTSIRPGGCAPRGSVVDANGDPVPGIQVRLSLGNSRVDQRTNADGHYEFDDLSSFPESAFGPDGLVSVALLPQDGMHDPARFVVHNHDEVPFLRTDDFAQDDAFGCVRDFDVDVLPSNYRALNSEIDDWPAFIQFFQNMRRAHELVDELVLDPDYGLPLPVVTNCPEGERSLPGGLSCPKTGGAYYWGTPTNHRRVDQPYTAYGTTTSELDHADAPDNREYHELGHAVLADLLDDQFPNGPGREKSHGGYYVNGDSSDAWSEGWAEFFSLMVKREIDDAPRYWEYKVDSIRWNVEDDWMAWRKEELAVAGVLLDMVDGDDDYQNVAIEDFEVLDATLEELTEGGTTRQFVLGGIRYEGTTEIRDARVWVDFLGADGSRVARRTGLVIPSTLRPGEEGSFLVPVDTGLEFEAIAVETRATVAPTDDDPVDARPLAEVVSAIQVHDTLFPDDTTTDEVLNVTDLHAALRDWYSPLDADGDGVDDIDQLFVAHGWHADVEGGASNRWHDPAETPGRSDHHGETFGGTDYEEMIPRPSAEILPEMYVKVDTGGVEAAGLVQVSYPPPRDAFGFGYVARPDSEGRIPLSVPPEDSGAVVTLTMLADGYEPALAVELTADEFWEEVDQHPRNQPFLTAQVDLRPGQIERAGESRPAWAWPLAALGGLVILAGSAGLWRRRSGSGGGRS